MNAPNQIHHTNPAHRTYDRRAQAYDAWAFEQPQKHERVLDGLETQATELLEELRSDFATIAARVRIGEELAEHVDWQQAKAARGMLQKWLEKLEAGRERETNVL